MNMSKKHLLLSAFVLLVTMGAYAQTAPPPPAQAASKKTPVPAQQRQNEGQRIFDQNCSRCHTTPDGFSPHISGTIVMHMRVRASLSQHDAQELLRFFNP